MNVPQRLCLPFARVLDIWDTWQVRRDQFSVASGVDACLEWIWKNRIWPVSMTLNSAVTHTEQINDMTINNIIHVTLIYFLPLIKRVPQFDKGKTLPWERERWGGERYHGESHPAISTFFWYNFCVQRERERGKKIWEGYLPPLFKNFEMCLFMGRKSIRLTQWQ